MHVKKALKRAYPAEVAQDLGAGHHVWSEKRFDMTEAIPLRRHATDVRRLLASSLEVLGRQAAALDIHFRIEAADDLPTDARIDPEKIAWAVTTLVGNSLRYARTGTRLMPGGSILVRLGFDAGKNELTVVVQDDGPGIPKEKCARLFERTEGAVHAAGLALLLIHDVIEAHGGNIDIESRTGGFDHGTTITLRLPAGPTPR